MLSLRIRDSGGGHLACRDRCAAPHEGSVTSRYPILVANDGTCWFTPPVVELGVLLSVCKTLHKTAGP